MNACMYWVQLRLHKKMGLENILILHKQKKYYTLFTFHSIKFKFTQQSICSMWESRKQCFGFHLISFHSHFQDVFNQILKLYQK